ncbi:MAG: hypothetical protein GKR97_17775 [Rhizobiaceae bacterium]|nr:hypothetical protein [Rhizobiaceae bacterium]
MQSSIEVEWGSFHATVNCDRLELSDNQNDFCADIVDRATLRTTANCPAGSFQQIARVAPGDQTLHALDEFARRTYVPESESLKTSGAGGDKVDDDE